MKRHLTLARPRHALAFLVSFVAVAACLFSCASTKGVPDARANAQVVAPPVGVKLNDSISEYNNKNTPNPAPLISPAKPALLPRLTDALGISTPEGRAHRQQVRLAKAAAPKVGKGGVLAINSNVSNGFKSTAPVTQADSGATVSNAAENSQQQNVQGDNNDLQAKQANPTQEAPGPLAAIADNLTGPLGYVLAGAGALLLFAWWAKRKNPMA